MTGRQLALFLGGVAVLALTLSPYVFATKPEGSQTPEVAAAVPAPEPAVASNPTKPAPEAKAQIAVDVFRVDASGQLLVAGTAPALAEVEVRADDVAITRGQSDSAGNFAIFADIGLSENARVLTLHTLGDDALTSDPFIIDGRAAPATADAPASPPAVVVAEAETVRVVTPPTTDTPPQAKTVILDSIGYDSLGDVQLAGRAPQSGSVRVYLDNRVVAETLVSDGAWGSDLPQVDPGTYTLRVDQIDEAGTVTSRIETPFQREAPEVLAAIADAQDTFVRRTIQPGATLWAIAEERYGNGVFYLKVFEANRDIIRDPDLIFPGQVFRVPN
ncbi:LysM peptidoglycan-binding domain-containing protein [Nereida sp. MMG025]|uniref:LysM peptidoglycan-binding domain-containing protein n=1 Tax=Nereida sp. MMG025 TaxID=2909981 RepID=UPI001F190057|nr:LysM peptidoglycan-binding domain-containing protein [Nereida sp. MMG025]MCF6445413.1 LysM peptidoglycan-binding domain-containing protein [Nereida sp. MMG025]